MVDKTYKEALADNELVSSGAGAGQQNMSGAEVIGATSDTDLDSGVTFTQLRTWTIDSEPRGVMLKPDYDSDQDGIVDAAESVNDGAGNSKTAAEVTVHIDNAGIHTPLNDTLATTGVVWSGSKINTELAAKADQSSLDSTDANLAAHVGDLDIHRPLNDLLSTTTVLWSGSKISSELTNKVDVSTYNSHVGDATIHAPLNDAVTLTTNLWSASKINGELATKATDAALQAHISDATNPHGVTAAQAGAAPASHVGDTSHLDADERAAMDNVSPVANAGNPFATIANITGGSKHVIQDEGISLTARANLNFAGAGVTVTDDVGNDASLVTIPGGAGGSKHVIQDEGVGLTPRDNLNFIGATVTATDNSGANASDITITAIAKLADDPGPSLSANLVTENNYILLRDNVPIEQGAIGVLGTEPGVFLARTADNAYDPADGGIAAKPGALALHGSIIEVPSFSNSVNRDVRVSDTGVLYAADLDAPGWEVSDTSTYDHDLGNGNTTGPWVEVVGLEVNPVADVAAGDRLDIYIELYVENTSNKAGTIEISVGVNGATPTVVGASQSVAPLTITYIPVAWSTTTHGGILATDVIDAFVRRGNSDNNANLFLRGTTAPHEMIVSVPSGGGGGGDPTNLGNTPGPSSVTITSSTGSDTVVAGAVSGTAGMMTGAQVDLLDSKVGVDAVFTTHAVFDAKVVGVAAIDFTSGNKQEVNATTHPAITVTSPAGNPANFMLTILNSGSLTSIAPAAGGTIQWENNTPPTWAGKTELALYYDGTVWIGSGLVSVS